MKSCPSCGSTQIWVATTDANGGYGPTLLPKLGKMFKPAKFDVHLCGKCGHVSFFVTEATLANLDRSGSGKWRQGGW